LYKNLAALNSLVVLEAWPWTRGSLRTPHEGLGLGLGTSGLGLGLERKVLTLPRPILSPKTQATWLLHVYALLTLTVLHNSLPFLVYECFKDLHVNKM